MHDPEVKVTRTDKDRYIVRVGKGWELVKCRSDVGHSIKSQLRWYDKLGGVSRMAGASRDRLEYDPAKEYKPIAKGWGPARVENIKIGRKG